MTVEFFLPKNAIKKNIHLSFSDTKQKKTLTFRTPLRIPKDAWDKERQRPYNIT